MQTVENQILKIVQKAPLKDNANINIGIVVKLNGIIGYETPTPDFELFDSTIKELESIYKSELIIVDATTLKRWDTLALRSIYPRIQKINAELATKGKAPIGIVGDTSKDPYHAALERYPNTEKLVPWFSSIDEYVQKYGVS